MSEIKIVNSIVEVKQTDELMKAIAKELANDTEEKDIEELLDEETKRSGDTKGNR